MVIVPRCKGLRLEIVQIIISQAIVYTITRIPFIMIWPEILSLLFQANMDSILEHQIPRDSNISDHKEIILAARLTYYEI